MFGYLVAQDIARSKQIKERVKQKRESEINSRKNSVSSEISSPSRKSSNSSYSASLMTPASSPISTEFLLEKPSYTNARSLSSVSSLPSPRSVSSTKSVKGLESLKSPSCSFALPKHDHELLEQSWSNKLKPSDPFDVVGDAYDNISKACIANEFWERCFEEFQMMMPTNSLNLQQFSDFYVTQFHKVIDLALSKMNQDLNELKISLHPYAVKLSESVPVSTAYNDTFRLAFVSTLFDSFSDAFTKELQEAWNKFMRLLIEVIIDSVNLPALPTVAASENIVYEPPPSFYRRTASNGSKKSNTLCKTMTGKSSVSSRSSDAESISSTATNTASISSSSTKKYYKGKAVPAFIQAELEAKKKLSPLSSVSTEATAVSAESDLSSLTSTKKKGKKKVGTIMDHVFFPTGSMGPLIP